MLRPFSKLLEDSNIRLEFLHQAMEFGGRFALERGEFEKSVHVCLLQPIGVLEMIQQEIPRHGVIYGADWDGLNQL